MAELRCPHCGKTFSVDDTEVNSIVQQIRDKEFEKNVNSRVNEMEEHLREVHEADIEARESKIRLSVQEEHDKEIQKLQAQVRKAEEKASALQSELNSFEDKKTIAVMEAVNKIETEKRDLETKLTNEKRDLETKLTNEKHDLEKALVQEKDTRKLLLDQKDEQIAYYKDLKTKMSTKMVGETLEQHCEIQFNQLRATAFQNAYFEKDNDARTGSKGDYIYRETDENGVEIISIMFEMKNEMDETATKHKNEDFFKKLDADRRAKKCEYAVLVSLLEPESELYNTGIVDVSHKYEKMYVIRPQFFIPLITLLVQTSRKTVDYQRQLEVAKNQSVDVTNFENRLQDMKEGFFRNVDLAHRQYEEAIAAIDKSIEQLQKIKEKLTSSGNNLRLANNKLQDITIKKLTRGNKTMEDMFSAES